MSLRPTSPYTPARRAVVKAGTGIALAWSVAGCSFFQTEAIEEGESGEGSGGDTAKGPEAPALAERVEAGDLPPVDERLPSTPLEVEPLDRIGTYGGTWHSAMLTQEDTPWLENTIAYEPLVRWIPNWTNSPGTDEIIPNVAEEFTENEDGTEFTFTLREGLKWSDAEPCTADDLLFTYDDYNVYEELHPEGFYSLWTNPSTGEPGRMEKVDEQSVRIVFEESKPGFLNEIAGGVTMIMPRHYLEQFHPKYNPDVDELVAEANLNDWIQLLEERRVWWTNPEMPTLNAWSIVTPLGEGTAVAVERNPYYWKVDPDGSQLPYFDKISCEVVLDVEVLLLKVTNGELDMQMRNFATVRNKPVVTRGQEEGNYRLFAVHAAGSNTLIIGFNQTHPDENKRELYSNKQFRVGLSHAINRQRIIDSIYAGQGEPWQCAPLEGHPAFSEELAKQYTEYDSDLANQLLDDAGYADRNGDGIRIGPGGEPIVVEVTVNAAMPDHVDALEMIREDWREVGVDCQIQRVAETLYWERVEANQTESSTWTGGEFDIRASQGANHYFLPSNPRGASRYGSTWAHWYISGGTDGAEPPEQVKRQLELFDEMRFTYEADAAVELAKQILEITKDQFYYIGISSPADEYGIVKNNFHNVPDEMPISVRYRPPGPTNPPQYFITDG